MAPMWFTKTTSNMGSRCATQPVWSCLWSMDAQAMSLCRHRKGNRVNSGPKARDVQTVDGRHARRHFTFQRRMSYGSLMSSPILNPPPVGYLGVCTRSRTAPWRSMVRLLIRPMMYLALEAIDTVYVDGKVAVTLPCARQRSARRPTSAALMGPVIHRHSTAQTRTYDDIRTHDPPLTALLRMR